MTNLDFDPRLRAALEPTAHDVAVADSVVDRVLAHGPDAGRADRKVSAGSTRCRRWVVPVAAASAAAVLALSVVMVGSWFPHDAPAKSGVVAQVEPQHVDMEAWLDEAYPTVSWVSSDIFRPPLVVMRVASCADCGVDGVRSSIVASAKAHPETRFLVILQGSDMREAGDLNTATALPNLRFLPQGQTVRLPGEPNDGKSLVAPALVTISPESTVTGFDHGSEAVEDALTSLPR